MFEIGNSLREARLRQRLDFPELEHATKIRGKYLRALEDEQFEILPAQTYVKGFLRTYAEVLGLDGQLYVDEYNSRFVVGDDGDQPIRARRTARAKQQRGIESRVVVLALLAIAAVTGLVIVAWKWGGGEGRPALPAVATAPAPSAGARVGRTSQRAPVRLVIQAVRGSSELEVHRGSASGPLLYGGTLEKGEPAQVFTGKRLWVSVASPEALRVRLNGRGVSLGHGGPRVAVVTRTGIHAARSTY